MTIYFSTNIPEMRAISSFNTATNQIAKSSQRLTTGQRINSGADDAVGFKIRENLRADIKINEAQASGLTTLINKTEIANSAVQQALKVLEGSIDDDSDGMAGFLTKLSNIGANPTTAEMAQYVDMVTSLQTAIGSARYQGATVWGTSSTAYIGRDSTGADKMVSVAFAADAGVTTLPSAISDVASLATQFTAVTAAITALTTTSATLGGKLSTLQTAKSQFDAVNTALRSAEGAISNVDTAAESSRMARSELLAQNAMNIVQYSRQYAAFSVSGLVG
jgi:flagellin